SPPGTAAQISLYIRGLLSHAYAIALLFFFTDPATSEIYTLSLHDALPICALSRLRVSRRGGHRQRRDHRRSLRRPGRDPHCASGDRKSTRLNSSHVKISYAVFCLKKKKKKHSTLMNSPTVQHSSTIPLRVS